VNLDGGLYDVTGALPAVRPFLLMSLIDSNQYQYAAAAWSDLIAHAGTDAYWLEVPISCHLSFTFSQLLSPGYTSLTARCGPFSLPAWATAPATALSKL